MLRKIICGLAVAILTAGACLVTASGPAQAHRAARPGIVAPSSATVGQTFAVVARAHHRGRVLLQRRAAGSRWRTVARARTRHAGRVVFRRTEQRVGRVAYRIRSAGRVSRIDRVTVMARPGGGTGAPPPVSAPALLVGVGYDTDDLFVGQTYRVGIEALDADGSPLVGRTVAVQRQDAGSSTWRDVGSYTTDSAGQASFTDSSTARGFVSYRATSGSLSGETLVVVYENLAMPTAAGNGLAVTRTGCGGTLAPAASGVDLRETSVAGACQVAVNDSLTLTWTFGGHGCTTVAYDGFSLEGSAGGRVRLGVTIDDADLSPGSDIGVGGSSGRLEVNGDPMQRMVVDMTVTAGVGSSLVGHLLAPRATCF